MKDGTPLNNRRRILYVLAEDAWFWTHRLPLARAARDAGYAVGVVTNQPASEGPLRHEGFDFFLHEFRRAGVHPWHDFRTIERLARLYAEYRPALVHHVAMKPVIYGSVAAQWARVPAIVNAVAGLGFALSSRSLMARSLRPVVRLGLRRAMSVTNARLIVQNRDDAEFFTAQGLVAQEKIRMVRGVGVCLNKFTVTPEPEGVPLVVLPGRLLRDKGVLEFVAAARYIRQSGVAARFALVGAPDDNPTSLDETEVARISHEGVVEVWGHQQDMAAVYRRASIVCLPSYREGLPKVLLEAGACGRAVVATDVPGCREVVRHGVTGLLVPPRQVQPLVGALLCLIRDARLRAEFGAAGRAMIEREFSEEKAIDDTFAVYAELLGHALRRARGEEASIAPAATDEGDALGRADTTARVKLTAGTSHAGP